MNNLWYSFRELTNSILFKLIILIQIVASIVLLYNVFEIKNYENSKLELIQNITKDKTIYTFVSKYPSPEDLLKDSIKGNKFNDFSKEIEKRYKIATVSFGEIFMDSLEDINKFVDSTQTVPGDKFKAINSLQCNSSFLDTFNIKLSKGNKNELINFTKLSSKEMENKIIPVILGDSYRKNFKLNDIIKTRYRDLKVTGFLKKNQFYLDKGEYDPTKAKSLDTYMILPSPIDIKNGNLVNSLLVSNNSSKEKLSSVKKYIEGLSKKYDVKFSANDPSENIDNFVNVLTYNANIKMLLAYIVMFFVVIALLTIFTNRINAKRKEFSVHLMHGATYKDIYIRIILEKMYLLIVSIAIAFYYLQKTERRIGFEVTNFSLVVFEKSVIVIFIIIIIVSMIPIYNISKNRINYLIKGE